MIQCSECEYFVKSEDGSVEFRCNPFSNIKEPYCLMKWQLLKLDSLIESQSVILNSQHKLAPLQNKIMKYIEREINDIEDNDGWKYPRDEDDDLI